jgi:pimeloyl-ACP methyl ester carboxylesterase
MAIVKCGEINLEYYDEGSGPPLLLIRGLGAQCTTWGEPFLAPLREHFRVIRFSNRGTGLSDKPDGAITVRKLADDAAALLDALGIERAHVFGVSLGGMIAQELAIGHPQRVLGLVLGCTFAGGAHSIQPTDQIRASLAPDPNLTREEQIRRAWPFLMTERSIEERREFIEEMLALDVKTPTPPATVIQQMVAVQSFDTYDRLPAIDNPALVVHGDSDALIPDENGRIIHKRIPGSQLEIIKDAGHMFFWEYPEATAALLTSFLLKAPVGQK